MLGVFVCVGRVCLCRECLFVLGVFVYAESVFLCLSVLRVFFCGRCVFLFWECLFFVGVFVCVKSFCLSDCLCWNVCLC